MDRSIGVIQDTLAGELAAATSSCIAVGTYPEYDGETSITLSDQATPTVTGTKLAFEAVLYTPSKLLSICSVLDVVLLEIEVSSESTRVQIWTNDTREPDIIEVLVLS